MAACLNRYRVVSVITWLLIAASCSTVTAQTPWLRSRAGFYVQATFQTVPAYDEIFGSAGQTQLLDRRLTEHTWQLYGEYGINRRTTLTGTLPGRFQSAGNTPEQVSSPSTQAGSLSGLGNVSIGIRQALLPGRWPLTGYLRVDFPVYKHANTTGLRSGYQAFTFLPLLSTGLRFSKAYWFGYAGYGLRTHRYNGFLNTGLEAGYRLRKVWLIATSELILPAISDRHPDLSMNNLRTGLYVDQQQAWSVGVKTIIELHRFWGITASVTGNLAGQYVPKRPAFGVGVYFKWD